MGNELYHWVDGLQVIKEESKRICGIRYYGAWTKVYKQGQHLHRLLLDVSNDFHQLIHAISVHNIHYVKSRLFYLRNVFGLLFFVLVLL